MSEMQGHIDRLKTIQENANRVEDTVALDAAVQAVDMLDRIKGSDRLRSEIEKEFGEDVWPT